LSRLSARESERPSIPTVRLVMPTQPPNARTPQTQMPPGRETCGGLRAGRRNSLDPRFRAGCVLTACASGFSDGEGELSDPPRRHGTTFLAVVDVERVAVSCAHLTDPGG
jgi:hypothetical protein